ncbi:hypothetical protein [Pannonibacter phragmitetus]|uniref:hypothetical protein n=1 Tax=Pannonibacter phragmitetus TaxID=121719 RepID=UPI003D2F1F37
MRRWGFLDERINEVVEDVRRRDRERTELQLNEGEFAGSDRLHALTPRDEAPKRET